MHLFYGRYLILLYLTGSDSGPFFFPRSALYFRIFGVTVIFFVFKGNDLHGGSKPCANPLNVEQWLADQHLGELWELAGIQNRVAAVSYPNEAAFTRSASFLNTPSTGFGNVGSQAPYKHGYLTFAEDGLRVFGDLRTQMNYLARENVFNAWNTSILSGIHMHHSPSVMLEGMTYIDEEGITHHMDHLPFDPVKDSAMVRQMRGFFSWYIHEICDQHYIRLTKNAYARSQMAINEAYKQFTDPTHHQIVPQNSRLPIKPRQVIPGGSNSLINTSLDSIGARPFGSAYSQTISPHRSKRKAPSLSESSDDTYESDESDDGDTSEDEIESIQKVEKIDVSVSLVDSIFSIGYLPSIFIYRVYINGWFDLKAVMNLKTYGMNMKELCMSLFKFSIFI
jgi:hypothetical protein